MSICTKHKINEVTKEKKCHNHDALKKKGGGINNDKTQHHICNNRIQRRITTEKKNLP